MHAHVASPPCAITHSAVPGRVSLQSLGLDGWRQGPAHRNHREDLHLRGCPGAPASRGMGVRPCDGCSWAGPQEDESSSSEKQFKTERRGGNYGMGTKEMQAANYRSRKETEARRRELFDQALSKFKKNDIEGVRACARPCQALTWGMSASGPCAPGLCGEVGHCNTGTRPPS